MSTQAIVWLKQPINTAFGETSVVVCDVGMYNEKHVIAAMNGGGSMAMEYRSVMLAEDVSDTKDFLFGNMDGVSDIRLS